MSCSGRAGRKHSNPGPLTSAKGHRLRRGAAGRPLLRAAPGLGADLRVRVRLRPRLPGTTAAAHASTGSSTSSSCPSVASLATTSRQATRMAAMAGIPRPDVSGWLPLLMPRWRAAKLIDQITTKRLTASSVRGPRMTTKKWTTKDGRVPRQVAAGCHQTARRRLAGVSSPIGRTGWGLKQRGDLEGDRTPSYCTGR